MTAYARIRRRANTPTLSPSIVSSWRTIVSALDRTKEGWHWFTAAQDRDLENSTHQGTLNYLPREIRDAIYTFVIYDYVLSKGSRMVLGCHDSQRAVYLHQIEFAADHNFICCLNLYPFSKQHIASCAFNPKGILQMGIRATSTLRGEFNNRFWTEVDFRFASPDQLRRILQLASRQDRRPRRLIFHFLSPEYEQFSIWIEWMKALTQYSQWLKELQVVTITIPCNAAEWVSYQKSFTLRGSIKEVIEFLDYIPRVIKRSAPGVTFVLELGSLAEEDRSTLAPVLQEAE